MHTHTHSQYTLLSTCVRVYLCVRLCMHVSVCAYACVCACVRARVSVCVCAGSHLTAWKSTSIDYAQFSKAEAYHENQFASDVMVQCRFVCKLLKKPVF